MATHDYVIANSTGANVRSDINDVLQAILTNNSSSSSPSTTAAYMFWADTTSGTLKIRNSSDNAWVELLQLDGTLTLEDGSASSPGLAFRDDLDTGVFSSAANAFNIATAGVERIEFGTTECVVNDGGSNTDFRIEGDTEANLFFLDAGNDRIGIGTNSPSTLLHISDDQSSGGVGFTLHNSNSSAGTTPYCFISAILNPSRNGGEIRFGREGTYGDQNSADSFMAFYTSANDTNEERMRVTSAGLVGIGTSDFSNTNSFMDDLVVQNTAQGSGAGISIIANATNGYSSIALGDTADKDVGRIQYNHSSNQLDFHTNGDGSKLTIDSSGKVGIGTTSPSTLLHTNLAAENGSIAQFGLSGQTNNQSFIIKADDSDSLFTFRFGSSNSTYPAVRFNMGADQEAMRIDSSGNVMIGTTTANALFDVNGQARFGGNKVTLDTDGSISGKISNSTTRAFLLSNTDVNADFFGGRVIQIGPTGAILIGGTAGLSPSSYSSPNIKLDPAGNSYFIGSTLSVGTSSHGAKMAVVGSMSTTNMTSDIGGYLSVSNTNQTDNNHTGIIFGDRSDAADFVAGVICQIQDHAQNFGVLRLVVNGSSGRDERMRITDAGSVGIGTTSPSATLDVVGSNAVAAEFHATGGSGGYVGFFTGASGAAQGYIGRSGQLVGVGGTADNLAIRSENEIEFAINSSGTVTQRAKITVNGIETTSTIKVETAANLVNPLTIDDSINNNFSTNAAVFRKGATGEVGSISCTRSATTYNTTSDYRLKENAVTISDGITRLKTLKPYRFNFISDSSSTVDGFFAHEVTAVPEAVKGTKDEIATEDIDGKNIKKGDPIYQQIDHSKLVPLLVAAVKELITKVETLEAA